MNRHQVEYIEYADRKGMGEALPGIMADEDIVHVDVIDLGRTLRITRLVPGEEGAEGTETASQPSAAAGGASTPEASAEPAESPSDGLDLIGDPEPDIVSEVHDSSLAELEALVAAGTYTAAQVLEAETGEGGRQRQNVQYAFRATE